jgi:hypothetical protein
MLRDHYAAIAAATVAAPRRDALRDASTGAWKPSLAPALGLPYGQQLDNLSKVLL